MNEITDEPDLYPDLGDFKEEIPWPPPNKEWCSHCGGNCLVWNDWYGATECDVCDGSGLVQKRDARGRFARG